MAAVDHINAVLREGDPENTLLALKKPEAQLPAVYPFAAVMYQNELSNLQKQNTSVRHSCVHVHTESQQEGRLWREGEVRVKGTVASRRPNASGLQGKGSYSHIFTYIVTQRCSRLIRN